MEQRGALISRRSIRPGCGHWIRRCCARVKWARSMTPEPMIAASVDFRDKPEIARMAARRLLALIVFSLIPTAISSAAAAEWRKYAIQESGLSVDIPVTVFTGDAGGAEGVAGRRFFTGDRRADLTIKSFPNSGNDSPASFLEKMQPPAGIQYKRVTSHFFAVSSIKDGRTRS